MSHPTLKVAQFTTELQKPISFQGLSLNMDSLTPHSKQLRAAIDDVVQRGQQDSLGDTLSNALNAITYRYISTGDPVTQFEIELNDLWYVLIQAGKNINTRSPRQDTIIRHLLATRALEPLQRSELAQSSDSDLRGITTFSDGRTLWSGLPLLSLSLVDEFTKHYYRDSYNSIQRENMAGFLGRLLSVGVYDGPALCALSLFREALETPRPLVTHSDSKELALGALISALAQMSQTWEYGLAILSSNQQSVTTAALTYHGDFPHLSEPGELARLAGITAADSQSGFSPQRWAFWIQRLETLSKCERESIQGDAEACLHAMKESAKNTQLL
ncbi:unnamed protein product [Clonostachys rosea]|uniref:Uncharacterized protein n=1 Tax=Bionectria ochroleuca TaxID=29856 RepID=A0ABY6TZ83_BIOOC|nr:unnamed protein product [Clonostachys rosea]